MKLTGDFLKFYKWWPKQLKLHQISIKVIRSILINEEWTQVICYDFDMVVGITLEQVFIFDKSSKSYDPIILLTRPLPKLTLNEYKALFRQMIKQVKVNEL